MDRFRESDIPIAIGVLDMDWHITDVDPKYGRGWTGFTWNRECFPDPAGFLDTLHKRGLRTALNLHPADGVQACEDAYPQRAFRFLSAAEMKINQKRDINTLIQRSVPPQNILE